MPDENGETEFLNRVKEIYPDTFTYFDVGAHVGTYTDMILERFENYQGYLFEPAVDTYQKCVANHGKNKNLTLENAALSDESGKIEYRIYPGDPTRNGIAGVGEEANFESEIHTVTCLTGDSYCKKNKIGHINLLKIDAEGYDLHVIKGFDEMLSNGKIDIIQFEYNVKHSETKSMLGDYSKYLKEKGFHTGALRQEGVDFQDYNFFQNDFKTGPNYIACREDFREQLSNFK